MPGKRNKRGKRREGMPLYENGLHECTLDTLSKKCVRPFVGSRLRPIIMKQLADFIEKIQAHGFTGDLWVDGSFVTETFNPEDVDLFFRPDERFSCNGDCTDEQRECLRWIRLLRSEDDTGERKIQVFLLHTFPEDHVLRSTVEWLPGYFQDQFSRNSAWGGKGIAVIRVGGERQ